MARFYTGVDPNPKARQILNILSKVLKIKSGQFSSLKVQKRQRDPFKTLVVTILSQNSTDRSAVRAFENLEESIGGISPENLAAVPVQRIRNAIAIGGLQWHKAPALKQLSRKILEQYAGDLDQILSRPFDEARELLMDLPQVGPKTADVLLVTSTGQPTIPVDTHVNRVSRRLGLAPLKGGYEKIRESLQSLFPRERYHQVHLLLIAHGRAYCTALRPKCPTCPVRKYCPYPHKTKSILKVSHTASRQ
jgi:endonuclease-3